MAKPSDFEERGRRVWRALVAQTPQPKRPLLEELCRLLDRLDRLHEANEVDLDPRLLAEARNTTLAVRALYADLTADAVTDGTGRSRLDDLAARRRRRDTGT